MVEKKPTVDIEKILKQWFIKLPSDSKKGQELMNELTKLLDVHDRKDRSNAFIYVLRMMLIIIIF